MISTYRQFLHRKKILANPKAAATVERLYDKYAARTPKQRFLDKLAGKKNNEASILKGMTLEDSREFQQALSMLTLNCYRVCRLARGHRQGRPEYNSYLPLEYAESVSIYVYRQYRR